MNLVLETTTGFLVPNGVAVNLGKGGLQQVLLQFVTSGVAALLPDGTPISLDLFTPDDLVTPKGTVTAWTPNATDKQYAGSINTNAGAMAWLSAPTLIGVITYGDSPEVESDSFHVRYGLPLAGDLGAEVERITVLQGNNTLLVPMIFMGQLTDEQSYGYFVCPEDGNILDISHEAQDIPTGSNVSVDLTKAGAEQTKLSVLTAGQQVEKTTFGSPLACQAGDVIRCKVKAVGSTNPGGWLKSTITYQITP